MQNTIKYSFYTLFFLTPLIWTSYTYEYFEFNKMMLVYLMTLIITGTWIFKSIVSGKFTFNKTPLDIPIAIFLASQVFSTIFSIDLYTSIFGYYTRQNGGLLSIFCYILLYYALVSNLTKEDVVKLLKVGFVSGLIVALWAIPESAETFNMSPSCGILYTQKYLETGRSLGDVMSIIFSDTSQIINTNCWEQDVKARVFATIGQPNWLAAYLGMVFFIGVPFFLNFSEKSKKIASFVALILIYLGFTLTYSRGGMIGFLTGFSALLVGTVALKNKQILLLTLLVLASLLLVNLKYGSALGRLKIADILPKTQIQEINSNQVSNPEPASGTQLEVGGTESGKIRLIVWQGGLEIFKHYPVFGSGVETFAYAYETHRPIAHNLTSEWDFTYNKAHNEYVNYLATTGSFGFLSYLGLIGMFVVWNLKYILRNISKSIAPETLFVLGIFAAYITYLVQNIFSFSVVIIALFFYLLPAIAFVITDSIRYRSLALNIEYSPTFKLITVVIFSVLLIHLSQIWYADYLFAKAEKEGTRGQGDEAYDHMSDAVSLNQLEPYYKAELSYTAAVIATSYQEVDPEIAARIAENADNQITEALNISPRNLSIYNTGLFTYFHLATLDGKYSLKTLEIAEKKIALSPNHPKYYYEKATILSAIKQPDEAILALEKAVELKPDYKQAYFSLADLYFEKGELEKAETTIKKVLTFIPNDPDVLDKLESWKEE